MKDLFSVSLFDITPINISQDEAVSKIIKSIEPDLKLISESIHENIIFARIDELDDRALDLLALQLHADFYDLAGNTHMKREAVKNSLIWHMKKGTEWAIHEALRQVGIRAKFHPWWETGGQPYTFTLDAIVTDDYYRTAPGNKITENIRRAVEEAKSARSYLAGLTTKIEFHDDIEIFYANADLLSGNYRLNIERPNLPEPQIIYSGLAEAWQGSIRFFPERPSINPSNIFLGIACAQFLHAEFGVDLNTMHELLILFEKRIFARFDEHEEKLKLELEQRTHELNVQIEELKDMLKWKNY